ncbi:MAG: cobalt-precorrin-6A reductase [Xenococcaceae cyanobacterium]
MGERIWLIGGTSESARIAEAIAAEGLPCTITVATMAAQALYPQSPELRLRVGRIDCAQMGMFCSQEQIAAVVDASHPYAVAISQGAIAAATSRQIPYLRYERPSICRDSGGRGGFSQKDELSALSSFISHPSSFKSVIELDSFDTLLKGDYLLGERVLLTIGYKALPLFQPWQNRCTLFARLLPAVSSLEVAINAGFTPDRLIALRPPISGELEKALWRQWQISLVVTKASGKAGGEEVKQSVAAELGIPLIVIARPRVAYPQQTSHLTEVLAFCRQYVRAIDP